MGENILTTLKILIIGESGVGKSRYVGSLCMEFVFKKIRIFVYSNCNIVFLVFHFSLMLRFTEDEFDSEQSITIGVDFKTKVINMDGVNVKLGKNL